MWVKLPQAISTVWIFEFNVLSKKFSLVNNRKKFSFVHIQSNPRIQKMKIPNFLKGILISLPIGVTLTDTVGYVARVDGISMQPSLNPDKNTTDYVFLSRWAIRSLEFERGDVISLISPKDPDQKIIKRVVGLQGDVISTLGYKKNVLRVPEGHCWVEGDHTGHSMDSNNFGPVSVGLVTAKASYIVWPPSRWQCIKSFLPDTRVPLNYAKI